MLFTFEGNVCGCHKAEKKSLRTALCPFQFCRSAVSPELFGSYTVYIFQLLCGRKVSQRLHAHLRRISATVVFPVIAVPPNLSFMCHHQKITEVCALLGFKNVGRTKNKTKQKPDKTTCGVFENTLL